MNLQSCSCWGVECSSELLLKTLLTLYLLAFSPHITPTTYQYFILFLLVSIDGNPAQDSYKAIQVTPINFFFAPLLYTFKQSRLLFCLLTSEDLNT